MPPACETRLTVGTFDLVASDLSRLECRVKPRRDANHTLVRAYDLYFDTVCAEVVPLSRAVLEPAADLRANFGFKTPAAIHLAAAITTKCDVLLTNDQRLGRCKAIAVQTL